MSGAPYPVLSTDAEVRSVLGPAVICPVADADNALVAELEFLPADDESSRLVVKVEIALAEIEDIPHVRRDITQWQTKSMGVKARLNQNHPNTVFRVRLEDIKAGTTYYYTVDSMEATGELDGVKSNVYHFTARE